MSDSLFSVEEVYRQQLPAGCLPPPQTLTDLDAARESLRRRGARAERLIELLAEYEQRMIAAVMDGAREECSKLPRSAALSTHPYKPH
ncbi:MAG: hypothetical protein OXD30_13485 [Bryobacterales bacterium]|nr:hypothetical protein [Bryobacterales bacterium]